MIERQKVSARERKSKIDIDKEHDKKEVDNEGKTEQTEGRRKKCLM